MDASAQRHVDAAAKRLLDKLAGDVVADAVRFVPVDEGDLRDSIHAEPATPRSVRIVAGTDHAQHVERGTSRMAAQPYLRPALYRKRGV